MWFIDELTRRASAEASLFEELVADGEVLSNAVNHVDWSEDEVLLSRCTFCGGDDTDGWVRLRRSGDLVVLQPPFGAEAWRELPRVFARMGIAVVPYALVREEAAAARAGRDVDGARCGARAAVRECRSARASSG